jgi:4-diphosphocytidyl-2-C-methyl-D-erythritol kinase
MLVTERACAKVNLALHVLGRRLDGYHELDSTVAFAEVYDVLTVTRAPVVSLTFSGPFADALQGSPDNTVLSAWHALAQVAGLKPAAFHLEKNLPVAAGLGGGSADAAAALRGLVKLFDLRISPAELNRLALQLGADVPVCLASQSRRMQGIGEIIGPASIAIPNAVVLVNPGIQSPTPKVFEALGLKPGQDFEKPGEILKPWHNDLTAPAIKCVPQIASVLAALESLPNIMRAGMSGSGATCFATFDNLQQAEAAAASISNTHPQWWVVATTLH